MDITLAGSALTYQADDEQLTRLTLEFAAFDGEVGFGTLPVPDSAAAISVLDGRAVRVDEGATRLTDGFIQDQDRDRGPQPAGTAREHAYSVMDANALLDGFRVHRSRPAETDRARVLYFASIDGPTWDTTWVLNSDLVTMPKKLYDSDGGWTSELIPDLVEFTGKTLFLHDLADGSGRCLHYHVLTDGHTSGLTITDVTGTADGATIFAPIEPTRNRTSVDLRNSIKGRDQAGRLYFASDPTSIGQHNADGLQHEALVDFETTGAADLRVKTRAVLASLKGERDTFGCAIGPLDEAALALIRAGDYIAVTSSVMGLTASAQRIAHMTLNVAIGENGRAAPGLWFALLELGMPKRRRARIAARKPPIILPPFEPECGDVTGIDTFDRADGAMATSPTGPNAANLSDSGVNWVVAFGTATIVSNRVEVAALTTLYLEPFGTLGSPAGVTFEYEATGDVLVSYFDYDNGIDDISSLTIRTDTDVIVVAGGTVLPFVITPGIVYKFRWVVVGFRVKLKVWELADAEPAAWMVDQTGTSGVSTNGVLFQYANSATSDPVFIDNLATGCSEPLPSQTVREIIGTGDGVTTLFTTTYPYVPNSIDLSASGLPEHDFAQTDPDAGTVTFGTAPFDTEVIRAAYQAQP